MSEERKKGYYWCKWDYVWDIWLYDYDDELKMNMFSSPKYGGMIDDGALFDEINEQRILSPAELNDPVAKKEVDEAWQQAAYHLELANKKLKRLELLSRFPALKSEDIPKEECHHPGDDQP